MYLNCHSQFSFRYGTLHVLQLLQLAKECKQKTIALTDINNTSACINFIREAKKVGIKPIVGVDFRNGVSQQFVGIAKNNRGFQNLNTYLSGFLLEQNQIPERAKRMDDTFIIYPFSRYRNESIPLAKNEFIGVSMLEISKLSTSNWNKSIHKLVLLQTVTVNNQRDFNIHRILRAIGKNELLAKLSPSEVANKNDKMYVKKEVEMVLKNYPEVLENTKQLMAACVIDFNFKGSHKSGEVNNNKQTFCNTRLEDQKLIRDLCKKNLAYRYPDLTKREEVELRLEKELKLIHEQGFESYFLINWDMLRFAREQDFFYVGRGSGANSVVAYLLQITDVDPVQLDLYFERFINPYRENPPDFDIDFSWKDRDIVTQYLFQKYGARGQIALVANYNSFTFKSLMRELGKVFGLPTNEIDALEGGKKLEHLPDDYVRLIYKYAKLIDGIPSHLSVHAGGIIISEKPVHYYSATSMPPKGYPLLQFDMVHAEDVGLYKYDILSQRGLGKIKDALSLALQRNKGLKIDIHNPAPFFEDDKVKELLRKGNAMGCFYVESPAMRMLLKKLKADNYLALVAASSIIRPGVAKSGMMREYILRSQSNTEAWRKKTPPILQGLMEETYGVMVYQEDVIKVAHFFAGLSLGEADMLRRGMSGKFRSRDEFEKVRQKFFDNCKGKGYSDQLTAEVWRQTESFAGYAFSKGHSASYAVESYQSLYLKAHYPMEFIVGVLNNGGGFYNTEMYVQEARTMGAVIEAPCINESDYLSILKGKRTIYLGFHLVRELENRVVEHFVNEREENGPFQSFHNFVNRCSVSTEQLSLLIKIDAFRFCGENKRELLWEMYRLLGKTKKTRVENKLFAVENRKFNIPTLDKMSLDCVYDQIESLGFPLSSPFDLLKAGQMLPQGVQEMMGHLGRVFEIVGYLVTIKNTRTSNGKKMQFGTFIDKGGNWIDTVHFPPVVERYAFRGKGCYRIKGKVVVEFGYATLEVSEMEKLEYMMRGEGKVIKRANFETVTN